jgi:hypothetical protein
MDPDLPAGIRTTCMPAGPIGTQIVARDAGADEELAQVPIIAHGDSG